MLVFRGVELWFCHTASIFIFSGHLLRYGCGRPILVTTVRSRWPGRAHTAVPATASPRLILVSRRHTSSCAGKKQEERSDETPWRSFGKPTLRAKPPPKHAMQMVTGLKFNPVAICIAWLGGGFSPATICIAWFGGGFALSVGLPKLPQDVLFDPSSSSSSSCFSPKKRTRLVSRRG